MTKISAIEKKETETLVNVARVIGGALGTVAREVGLAEKATRSAAIKARKAERSIVRTTKSKARKAKRVVTSRAKTASRKIKRVASGVQKKARAVSRRTRRSLARA